MDIHIRVDLKDEDASKFKKLKKKLGLLHNTEVIRQLICKAFESELT